MDSTKYNVVKDCMNPWGTPIAAGSMVEFTAEDMADEKVAAAILQLIADGAISVVPPPVEAKIGDTCEVDGKPGTMQEVDGALICVVTPPPAKEEVQQTAPLKEEEEVQEEEEDPNALRTPEKPLRHVSGKMVLLVGKRVVGEQTFNHVRLDDGTEQDMTDRQFSEEVHETIV